MTDVHCHVRWQGYDIDDWVEHFASIGIDRVWALAWESWWRRVRGEYELPTRDVEEAAQRYPDLFVPFSSIDPREADFDDRFDYYVEHGFRGFGEMKLRLRIDNDDCKRVYARCGEVGWPVLFHMDRCLQPGGQWYMTDVERLEPVLGEFPDTTFIGHGPGWWAEVSGDADEVLEAYPKGPVTEGGRLPRMLRAYDNLYADLSAGSGHNAITRDAEWGRQFVIDLSGKLMYGTADCDTKHLETLRAMDLPAEVFDAIMEGNSRRLVP